MAKPETVLAILEQWLKANGYDGLYSPGECACKIGDLIVCESECSQCAPGYLWPGDEEFE
tara:strand:- start:350 stop:529 length:180 start_codon:yes stop_codon:yes gene_type:complete